MQASHRSPLRTLFLTEAVLKLLSGAIFILSPSTILNALTYPPHTPVSVALVRNLGTQTIVFSVPLFLAARRDGVGVGARRLVYWTLLAREGFLCVGLLGQMVGMWVGGGGAVADDEHGDRGGEGVARAMEEGKVREKRGEWEDRDIDRKKLIMWMGWWVAELVPFVVGRVWVLGWRREWFVSCG